MFLVVVAGSLRISLALGLVVFATLALPDTTQATSLNEIKKLTASDAEVGDSFGSSVAFSGDTVIVGASRSGDNVGAAYVFQRDHGGIDNWGEVKKLTASDANSGDFFGASVSVSGGTAAVGAPNNDGVASNGGALYIFQRDQGGTDNWGEVKKLTASDGEVGDQLARVALGDDLLIGGAASADAGGVASSGKAYIFQRDEGGKDNWGEAKKLTASDAQTADRFGSGVALSGGIAIVGATEDFRVTNPGGAAYVFQRDQGGTDNWGEVKKLTASDGEVGDDFGVDIGLDGNTAVVGAVSKDGGLVRAGAAYVFQRDHGGIDNWGEVKKLVASNAQSGDRFGSSVAFSGDTVIVGASRTGNDNAGTAYLFQRNEGDADNWGEVTKLVATDLQRNDYFGGSVAVSGDVAIVGAQDVQGDDPGAAYVFQLPAPAPAPTPGPPVGGISLDSNLRSLPLETTGPDSSHWGIVVWFAGATSLFALGGAAWYVGRRRV